ncbi:rRNA pseudouridine synthase [Candidatus Peregrinibacteria bacterium]|nr:rRNA pseudouridine synthase [Candidatus Peregrinibacteria bacterium]
MRLHKHIADLGIASRREAERLIAEGAVKVNGKVVTEMGIKIDPEKDAVEVSEKTLAEKKEKLIYIAMNKPKGYVCSTHRTHAEPRIVLDLLKGISERVYPVGRLDKESTGLLLLTNDGDFAYRLTHPSFEHEKEYLVETMNDISDGMLEKLREGIPILGQKTLPPKITRLTKRRMLITLKEGKNRQIRRLLRKVGTGVLKLKRVRIAKLRLDPNLEMGEYVFLSRYTVEKML